MRRGTSKLFLIAFCGLMLLFLAAGCTGKSKQEAVSGTVTIMYIYQDSFYREYGDLFASKYPDVSVTVAETNNLYHETDDRERKLREWIDKEKPDILELTQDDYERLAGEGVLLDLEPLIQKDKYPMESFLPSITELLKVKGGGRIYGLPPSFMAAALFYNQDLFDQHGVAYPTDQMGWMEVLALAERFGGGAAQSPESKVYGLSLMPWESSPVGLMYKIGRANQLSEVNAQTMQVQIDSEGWKQAATQALAAFRSDSIKQIELKEMTEDVWKKQAFLEGKSAMTLAPFSFIYEVDEAFKKKGMQWSLVTEPVDPKNPAYAGSLNVGSIYAINAKSANVQAAWKLISYMSSDEMAKIKSRSSFNLLSRKGYMTELNGHSLDSFYKLDFNVNNRISYGKIPTRFYNDFYAVMSNKLQKVQAAELTLDQAFREAQQEGQHALDAALAASGGREEK
ncbi:ABC transporter substrate-binding protein [Paenibacillus gorillae]|uniref:ABC transporter substrate-binding protein n=1 Tax=Paenibacillus gorillae TaxID=1243662 RepID=UPI0004AD1852|nr:extracellular solute-binding protein [Paenibacillus gorillae]